MFGYHDSNRCAFDIWSPVNSDNAIENRAFSAYCKHKQECDDIVKAVLVGQIDFVIDDHFSQGDLEYISLQLKKRGINVELNLY